jgi:hypothetical protein
VGAEPGYHTLCGTRPVCYRVEMLLKDTARARHFRCRPPAARFRATLSTRQICSFIPYRYCHPRSAFRVFAPFVFSRSPVGPALGKVACSSSFPSAGCIPARFVVVLSRVVDRLHRVEEVEAFRPPVLAFGLDVDHAPGVRVDADALDARVFC